MSLPTQIVAKLWRESSCLRISGIYRPDDTVARLDFRKVSEDTVQSFVVETRSVADVLSEDPENRSHLFVADVEGPAGTRISAGATNEGSEGFVAVSSDRDSTLLWLAFFDFSNPFERGTLRVIDGERFSVRTNCDARWTFSLADPTNVRVTKGECGWPGYEFWPNEDD
jgi:hypothetical protein